MIPRRPLNLSWPQRLESYEKLSGFPQALFLAADGRVVGTWIMGNDYRVKSKYYGGYPATYLRRIKALFPDKQRILHLFSGKVDLTLCPGDAVDINEALNPTYCVNAETLTGVPLQDYDLVLADPQYSGEDAEHYGTPMVNRNKVIDQLSRRLSTGTHIVWLDQVLPMWRKTDLALEGVIGVVRSTNHRFRVASIFAKLSD